MEPGDYTCSYLGEALVDTGPVKTPGHLPEVSGGWMCAPWNSEKCSEEEL